MTTQEKRNIVQLGLGALVVVGCPMLILFSLYSAAFSLWRCSAEPERSIYWGVWSLIFLITAVGALMVMIWVLIAPVIRQMREKRRKHLRLAEIIRESKARNQSPKPMPQKRFGSP